MVQLNYTIGQKQKQYSFSYKMFDFVSFFTKKSLFIPEFV